MDIILSIVYSIYNIYTLISDFIDSALNIEISLFIRFFYHN